MISLILLAIGYFALILVLLVLLLCFLNRSPPLVPGLPSLSFVPIFGNFFHLPDGTKEDFFNWQTTMTQKLGAKSWAFSFFCGGVPNVMTSDPKVVEYMLKTNFDNFVKGPSFRRYLRDLLGNGIFNTDGDDWYKQRKLGAHIFSINNFKLNMMVVFLRHGRTFEKIVGAVKPGETVDIQNLFFRYTLSSFCEIAFGIDIHAMEETPPFARCFDFAQGRSSIRFITPMWWMFEYFSPEGRKMRNSMRELDNLAYGVIRARKAQVHSHRAGEKDRDLLGLFLEHKDDKGDHLTDKYLRDVIMNFILAGRDTTAGALSWMIYELSQHPEVEEKMVAEMREVFGSREPTYDDMHKLNYTQAVISETLRLHPSVPVDLKMAVKDDVLPGGIKIKAGTAVNYLIYAMGRDPDLWPEPLKFDPERFVKRPAANIPLHEFPVFNAGPRTCLGMNMAHLEMKAILSQLLPRYSFRVVSSRSEFFPTFPALTLSIQGGLPVHVVARH